LDGFCILRAIIVFRVKRLQTSNNNIKVNQTGTAMGTYWNENEVELKSVRMRAVTETIVYPRSIKSENVCNSWF